MSCVFCQISAGEAPASVVYRDDKAMVIMDLFPVSEGHLLVIPHCHEERVEALPAGLAEHLMVLGNRAIEALRRAGLAGEGQNLLINNGAAANQHVPHVHLHVVPRQRGDNGATLWRWATRMLHQWGRSKRRRQLDALASRIAEGMTD